MKKFSNPMLPPWIVMFTVFVFFVKGLEDHAFLLLYTLAVLGLYYLSREGRTLTIIIHWNLLGMAAGRTVPGPSGPWLAWPASA